MWTFVMYLLLNSAPSCPPPADPSPYALPGAYARLCGCEVSGPRLDGSFVKVCGGRVVGVAMSRGAL